MSTFDIKKSCTFDDITFPVMKCTLTGSLKKHTHEFAYAPGGATELMARKNYKIKIESIFCDSFPSYGTNLYPTALGELRRRFEAQLVSSLNVPNLGVIRAYASDWTFTQSFKVQNGEDVEIVFEEDTTDLFSVETILKQKASGFDTALEDYGLQVDAIKKKGIFDYISDGVAILDKITEVADQVQSVFDTIQLFDSLIAAKIESLTDILERAADDVEVIKHPEELEMIEAFKSLWKATQDLGNTLTGKGLLKPYEVQKDSTLAEICIAIYGNTNKAQELLSLNSINDPFLIPAGEVLIFSDT